MKAQAAATGGDDMSGMGGMAANLELNPSHPAVLKLKEMVGSDSGSAATRDYATLLYDVAAVSSGCIFIDIDRYIYIEREREREIRTPCI